TPPVMGDAAISAACQKQHLIFPGIRVQRPPVTKDHGLSSAPVLVINLSSILRGDRRHNVSSLSLVANASIRRRFGESRPARMSGLLPGPGSRGSRRRPGAPPETA